MLFCSSQRKRVLSKSLAIASFCAVASSIPAFAQQFTPGNLVISRTVYDNNANNVVVGTILPPNCASTTGSCAGAGGAPYNGTYPNVFSNDVYDAAFGLTTPIFLDQLGLDGSFINTLAVPTTGNNKLVSSFSSKSELALSPSLDNNYITFMGYVSTPDQIDVSNSNTPGAVDSSNPDGQTPTYRGIAQVDTNGNLLVTETNTYSGNNGRVAILNNVNGANVYYTAGNGGNGANPQPSGIVVGTGAQIVTPATGDESTQTPGTPTPVGSFSITQLGATADKVGKDDNFRGMTVFNNVLYYTKGSGGNGVNSVYFVDTVGGACPNGVGLPKAGATLPTNPLTYNPATVATTGLPNNMCILAGFPSTPNKTAKTTLYPFSLFFANATTLYVTDEGDQTFSGATPYAHAAAQTTAGLQKWVFNAGTQQWTLAYTMTNGLNLGTPYTVSGYPTGNNLATSLPWAPATDGLRNMTGAVGLNGLVVIIYATTSTVSGNGDVGADPNKLIAIADLVSNTNPANAATYPSAEIKVANYAEVLRGVAFTPGSIASKLKVFAGN